MRRSIEQYRAWAEGIARAVARWLPPSFEVDDLVQEALVETWRALEDYDQSKCPSFTAYAYQRVRGAVLMSVRRRHWTAATMEEIPESAETPLRPDAIVEDALGLDGLDQHVARLSPRARRLIVEHYQRDIPLADIARRMRVSVGTAHALRAEALAALRAMVRV